MKSSCLLTEKIWFEIPNMWTVDHVISKGRCGMTNLVFDLIFFQLTSQSDLKEVLITPIRVP